ncbi:benzoyl-CoA reductase [Intrasporangium chromatireducens Q5-1]|uniref:Benzoyl-CoA reductase n=1 Tax=Intrasporangium chromatireducens Q5-1 TaxID=584657 RepID=W9GSK6_9MICO|nr:acyl-CoA dehydratase activase [Intrasporangium chromatireducens]EWT07818.1 benzoyl-CoA reductase [Intrasporangium chromatireducens Q5-1]
MALRTMGVDLGSTTAKAVVVDEAGGIVAHRVVQMGAVSRRGVAAAIDAVLDDAGLERGDLGQVIATGYGRRLVPDVDRTFTEITCHARGVAAMCPGAALVIDIGGQDSKAIRVDEVGLVDDFAMNDRCASGTGRFFEVLARALECRLDDLDDLALAGGQDLEVSSMCATFAETEIISLLAEGEEPTDIAASVHRAVSARTLGLVSRVGRAAPVVMTGGVARSRAAVHFLAESLRAPVIVPAEPQISGAYGAALLGLESLQGETRVIGQAVDREHVHTGQQPNGRDCSTCSLGRAKYQPIDVELWTASIAADRRP